MNRISSHLTRHAHKRAKRRIHPLIVGVATIIGMLNPLHAVAAEEPLSRPDRIVSLAPSLTKQVYLLGAAPSVVGITTYCPQPAPDAGIPTVGTITEPSIETLLALKPDIVLATTLTDIRRVRALQAVHTNVVIVREPTSFEGVCEQTLSLGKTLGRTNEAAALVLVAKQRCATLTAAIPPASRPTVFLQIGADPLFTVNKGTFLHDLLVKAGGRNIAADARVCTYSREAVLAANPEVIVITTMGLASSSEIQAWRQYPTLSAVTNNRIHTIDADTACSTTPLGFVNALEMVIRLLHPGAFPPDPAARPHIPAPVGATTQ